MHCIFLRRIIGRRFSRNLNKYRPQDVRCSTPQSWQEGRCALPPCTTFRHGACQASSLHAPSDRIAGQPLARETSLSPAPHRSFQEDHGAFALPRDPHRAGGWEICLSTPAPRTMHDRLAVRSPFKGSNVRRTPGLPPRCKGATPPGKICCHTIWCWTEKCPPTSCGKPKCCVAITSSRV